LVKIAPELNIEKDVLEALGYNSDSDGDYMMGKDVMQMMKYYTK
jgi:hypothetical protein